MLLHSEHEDRLDRLTRQVRNASAPTIDLFHSAIAECIRLSTLIRSGKAARIEQLMKTGAWTDAALSVIECELPAWTLRRLIYEDGQWICSLTKEPNLPAGVDDTADAHHESLPLAILSAFFEARQRVPILRNSCSRSVPQIRTVTGNTICCDNFA